MNKLEDFQYLVGRSLTPKLKESLNTIAGPGLFRVWMDDILVEDMDSPYNPNRVNARVKLDLTLEITRIWVG